VTAHPPRSRRGSAEEFIGSFASHQRMHAAQLLALCARPTTEALGCWKRSKGRQALRDFGPWVEVGSQKHRFLQCVEDFGADAGLDLAQRTPRCQGVAQRPL